MGQVERWRTTGTVGEWWGWCLVLGQSDAVDFEWGDLVEGVDFVGDTIQIFKIIGNPIYIKPGGTTNNILNLELIINTRIYPINN